jgi:O-antigen/teichoic acid export membrane protein
MSRIARLRSRLGAGGFARNVSVLMAGTLGAHLITVAGIPVTTRLFSPEAFSILAVYSAILSILLTLATLSLHIGIPIADTHRRALGLLSGAGLVLLANTALLSLVLLVAGDLIIGLLNRPDFASYLFLLMPGFLLGGGYSALQMWFSRQKQFPLVARTRVMRSAGGTGTQLAFGFAGGGAVGLVLGHMLYNGLGVFGLLRRFLRDERATLKQLTRADLVDSLRLNKGYVYFTTLENLANVAAIQLPVLAIAANPATGEVGYLYLAQTVMMLPMMLIGSSVGQVFIAEAPQHYRDGRLWPFTKRVLRGLALTGVPLLTLAGVLAPFLAGPILGQEWTRTGELIAWITPWMILQFLSSPLSTIFYVAGRQSLAMMFQFFGLALRLGAVLLAISLSPTVAMPVYALSGAAFYLSMILVILAIARNNK